MTCESENEQDAECTITTGDEVRLVEQLSRADCVEGESWGIGRYVVWVRDGCRAIFEADPAP